MRWLVRSFLQGCLVLFPVVGTVTVVWWVLSFVDRLVPLPVPGLGLALALVVVTLVGAVTSNVIGRRVVAVVDNVFTRLPFVKLLYGSIRDLVGAFVGERGGLGRPAIVTLDEVGSVRVLGFLTSEELPVGELPGHVAVYLPQSYNFAGNLLIVPRERVTVVDADPTRFLAFVVSGGIAGRDPTP